MRFRTERDAFVRASARNSRGVTPIAEKQQKSQLEKAGEYRQLYEKATADLEIEKQNADRLARMEATMEASVQRRVESLDERFRSLVPDGYTAEQKTEWLDTNEALLTAPTAPNFNAGAGAGIPGSNPLRNVDPAQLEGARIMGVDEEGIKRAMQELTSEDQLGPQNGDRQERGNLHAERGGHVHAADAIPDVAESREHYGLGGSPAASVNAQDAPQELTASQVQSHSAFSFAGLQNGGDGHMATFQYNMDGSVTVRP